MRVTALYPVDPLHLPAVGKLGVFNPEMCRVETLTAGNRHCGRTVMVEAIITNKRVLKAEISWEKKWR